MPNDRIGIGTGLRSVVLLVGFGLAGASGGCSAGVSGEVRNAETGAPIPGALVEVTDRGWGRSDGTIVWDKDKVHAGRTNAQGRFRIDVDGGYRLTVRAAGYRTVETSLCSRSPMIVRIGGRLGRESISNSLRLDVGPRDGRTGWTFAGDGSEADPDKSDLAVANGSTEPGTPVLAAPSGAVFVEGTGDPPPAPQSGYRSQLPVDLLECGWIYVRTADGSTTIVRSGTYGVDTSPSGRSHLTLPYGRP